MVIAAFAARMVGLGRSALGAGGGRAAVCGEEASAERSLADGANVAGITTGGVSPSAGERGNGGAFDMLEEDADIIACLCIGVQTVCE